MRASAGGTTWRRFIRVHRAAIKGKQHPAQFFARLQKFYTACSAREAEVYHQALSKKLKVGTAAKIAAKVWPEFHIALPSSGQSGSRASFFFIVERSGLVSAITHSRRPYPLLADCFGESLSKLGRGVIYAGAISSSGDLSLLEKFLNSKTKSMTRSQFNYFFRSLRLTIIEAYALGTSTPITARKRAALIRRYRGLTRARKQALKISKLLLHANKTEISMP